jgi:carbon-monoxide dehydrogenase large subunit
MDRFQRDIAAANDGSVACKTNRLGVKGCGEAGCAGALPSVMNAIVDALGVRHIDMPVTPEKVWHVLNERR